MKIVIAFLMSLLVTVAIPAAVKNCSGHPFLDTQQNIFSMVNPVQVTMAYATWLDSLHRSCVVVEKKPVVIHKWRDETGVLHYTDGTQDAQQADEGSQPVDGGLYIKDMTELPKVAAWLPYAIIGFCFGVFCIFYFLLAGLETVWQYFREEDAGETTIHHERASAGEAVEFFSISPYEVLGVAPQAKPEEIDAAYERQLHRLHNKNTKVVDDRHKKLILVHQAYEAIKRKKDDKFIAAV